MNEIKGSGKDTERKRLKWYKIAEKNIKKHFEVERKGVLNIVKNSSTSEIEGKIKKYLKKNSYKLETLFKTLYFAVTKEFGTDVFNELIKKKIAISFDVWSKDVIDYINDTSASRVVLINNTTKQEIKYKILQSLSENASIEDIAASLDTLYLDRIIPNRSLVIATTEVASISNYASLMGAIQAGANVLKKWVPMIDLDTRVTHVSMIQHPAIDLLDYFNVGYSRMQYPGDPVGDGIEVINCRCSLLFVNR